MKRHAIQWEIESSISGPEDGSGDTEVLCRQAVGKRRWKRMPSNDHDIPRRRQGTGAVDACQLSPNCTYENAMMPGYYARLATRLRHTDATRKEARRFSTTKRVKPTRFLNCRATPLPHSPMQLQASPYRYRISSSSEVRVVLSHINERK